MEESKIIKDENEELLKAKINMPLVVKLINSDIPSYKIGKAIGVSAGNISRLKNKKRKIENINVKTAYQLSEYAKSIGIK
ncbi:hypothetical protein [Bombilactobacillus bombi]|uniref:hypothetical protein n=1 Tax=Bombilactobacillus bombi TaxID=1303590 RepID=UPI0035EF34C3